MKAAPRPRAVRFDVASTVAGLNAPTVFMLSPAQISVRPDFNPRGRFTGEELVFSEASLLALGESMQMQGVLTPLIVSQDARGTYWLIAGERRLRAARLVGLSEVPVMLQEEQDALRVALVENLQRENLNAVDETFGVMQLLGVETGLDEQALVSELRRVARGGKDPHGLAGRLKQYGGHALDAWVRHRLAFLDMSEAEKTAVRAGQLPWRTVAELVRLGEHPERQGLLESAIEGGWSHAATRREVDSLLGRVRAPLDLRALVARLKADDIARLKGKKRQEAQALLEQLLALVSPAGHEAT